MSYHPSNRRRGRRALALGGVTDVASAAVNVVLDPCLGETAKLVNRLHELSNLSITGKPLPPTQTGPGIGLCNAVPPLRAVVWVKERPWVASAVAAGAVGVLVGIGYLLGSSSRGGR